MTLTELQEARAAVAGQLAVLDMQIKEAEQTPPPAVQRPHLPRMRTLDETMKILREMDPDTSVSKYYVRQLALSGKISTRTTGRRRLINVDALIEYLSKVDDRPADSPATGRIRRIDT